MELKEVQKLMPLNIQFFADGGEDGAKDDGADKETPNDGADKGTPKADEKKYSDKEMNDISTKNVSKALAKQLKDLGIDDVEKAKGILAKAKEEEEANKSVDEKTKELTTQRDKALLEVVNSKIENALLRKGVKDEKVERAVRLVDKNSILNEKGEIDSSKLATEIEAVLKDFPELISKKEDGGVGFKIGGDGKEDNKDRSSELSSIFGNKK